MISEINKFSLNWLLAVLAPGCLVVLFVTWGCVVNFHLQISDFKDLEALLVFFYLLFAFIAGILNDSLARQVEQRNYLNEKKHPRLQVLEKNPHWLEDLDPFYFNYLGIHLYDWDANSDKPKPGNFNGKKVNHYNLSQFEHYANYILAGNSIYAKLEAERSKYLLCRNLCWAFRFCGVLGLLYYFTGIGFTFARVSAYNLFHNAGFCVVVSILLLALSFYLASLYKTFRISYTTQLYRYIRYHYLTTIQ